MSPMHKDAPPTAALIKSWLRQIKKFNARILREVRDVAIILGEEVSELRPPCPKPYFDTFEFGGVTYRAWLTDDQWKYLRKGPGPIWKKVFIPSGTILQGHAYLGYQTHLLPALKAQPPKRRDWHGFRQTGCCYYVDGTCSDSSQSNCYVPPCHSKASCTC